MIDGFFVHFEGLKRCENLWPSAPERRFKKSWPTFPEFSNEKSATISGTGPQPKFISALLLPSNQRYEA